MQAPIRREVDEIIRRWRVGANDGEARVRDPREVELCPRALWIRLPVTARGKGSVCDAPELKPCAVELELLAIDSDPARHSDAPGADAHSFVQRPTALNDSSISRATGPPATSPGSMHRPRRAAI